MSKPQLTQRNEVFNQQIQTKVVSSRYDLSERSTGSFRMGALYPIYCRNDILPGDRFSISCAPFIRFMPLVAPALTNVDVEVRFFFVPYRLLWAQWKKYISPNTANEVKMIEPFIENSHLIPNVSARNFFNVAGSIYDYMGCASLNWSRTDGVYGGQNYIDKHGANHSTPHFGDCAPAKGISSVAYPGIIDIKPLRYSAYPFLAYNLIWNEYFRDENMQDELKSYVDYVNDVPTQDPWLFCLRRVNWEKDYFSSALPFVTQSAFSVPSVADGMSIEQLREESALTRWLEKQAVGGHRYQESILTHFGVNVPDEAAQIPVYLGGGRCPLQIGSVEQTSSTDEVSPLATLGGKGTASDSFHVDNVEFREHGVVLGLMYVRPKALYADVNSRDLLVKSDRHDYYWPDFANLGDEAVKSDELNPGFAQFNSNPDYGYQMRYASYRTSFDRVHGQLRPTEPMESWTQARSWVDYSGQDLTPLVQPIRIYDNFIRCIPSNRIFAVTDDVDNLVGEVVTYVDATRPMPNYVDPKID